MNILEQKKPSAICIGGANVDRKIFLKETAQTGTSNLAIEKIAYGGVARNIAENLARLNVAVTLLSIVGKDAAADGLIEHISCHIDIAPISRTEHYMTGAYSALIEPSGEMYIGLAAMEICNLMSADWIYQNERHLDDKDWLICDLNIMPDGVKALIDWAERRAKKLAIVGVSAPKMRHLPTEIGNVTIGIFNVDESQAYFNTTQDSVAKLANMWLQCGFQKIVVTAGTRPFAYAEKGAAVKVMPVVPTERIDDVTGAGDAFSAAVLYGLINGHSLREAVQIGALNATLNIQSADSVRADLSEEMLKI